MHIVVVQSPLRGTCSDSSPDSGECQRFTAASGDVIAEITGEFSDEKGQTRLDTVLESSRALTERSDDEIRRGVISRNGEGKWPFHQQGCDAYRRRCNPTLRCIVVRKARAAFCRDESRDEFPFADVSRKASRNESVR